MPAKDVLAPIANRGTLGRVAIYALAVGLYALVPVLIDEFDTPLAELADLPAEFHAALTLVLGWLLVFRTNTAYSRWWEARTLWGALVNCSRNLTAKIARMSTFDQKTIEEFRRLTIAFPYALRDHLRSESALARVPGFEEDENDVDHIPAYIVSLAYDQLGNAKRNGTIDGDELRVIDEELRRLLDVCGGCERIYKTRVARSYRVFARQCTFLYLVTLPWGISNDFGWWTIPLTVITSYFMLGLETVAEHVEEPFGYDDDDLDLDGLCQTIEASANEISSPVRA